MERPTRDINSLTATEFERFLNESWCDLEPDENRSPGKFEGNMNQSLAIRLYTLSMEGWADEMTGNVSEVGWHVARLGRFLLWEDEQGFVSVDEYQTIDEAKLVFTKHENEYAQT